MTIKTMLVIVFIGPTGSLDGDATGRCPRVNEREPAILNAHTGAHNKPPLSTRSPSHSFPLVLRKP
jgi:hypothetical protein